MGLRTSNPAKAAVVVAAIGLCALGACTTGNRESPATLEVHVGLFGGPARVDGGMALSNSPVQGQDVTAVDTRGRKHVARTDSNGTARMHLLPGPYAVSSGYCGTGSHRVTLIAHQTATVQIDCDVP